MALLRLLALVPLLFAGVFLYFGIREAIYVIGGRAHDVATLANKASLDLSEDTASLAALNHDLGPPASASQGEYSNVTDYRWFRQAVSAEAIGDTPTRIVIGDRTIWRIFNPVFPGSFLGLRIGGLPPSPSEAAALRARASTCCAAEHLLWGLHSGRIAWIEYSRATLALPVPQGTGG